MKVLADKVFASYTFNDHPLGFIDALWTLKQYEKNYDRLYKDYPDDPMLGLECVVYIGKYLRNGLNVLFQRYNFPARCIGHPARSAIFPTDDGAKLQTLLSRVVDEHNVLLHMPQFVTLAHNLGCVEQTLMAVEAVLKSWQ